MKEKLLFQFLHCLYNIGIAPFPKKDTPWILDEIYHIGKNLNTLKEDFDSSESWSRVQNNAFFTDFENLLTSDIIQLFAKRRTRPKEYPFTEERPMYSSGYLRGKKTYYAEDIAFEIQSTLPVAPGFVPAAWSLREAIDVKPFFNPESGHEQNQTILPEVDFLEIGCKDHQKYIQTLNHGRSYSDRHIRREISKFNFFKPKKDVFYTTTTVFKDGYIYWYLNGYLTHKAWYPTYGMKIYPILSLGVLDNAKLNTFTWRIRNFKIYNVQQ